MTGRNGRVPKTALTASEPKEWQEGSARAREARENVAAQLAELVTEREMTGGEQLFAVRMRELAEARRRGDRTTARAALMEVLVSGAHWVAAMDLQQDLRQSA